MSSFSINGIIVPEEQAKVSVLDRGLLYGDGIFEGIRMYNRHIFKLDEHIDRLYDSAELIYMDIKITKEQFKQEIINTAKASEHENAYVRVTVSRIGVLGLQTTKDLTVTRMVIVTPLSYQTPEAYEKGIHLMNVSISRIPNSALPMRAKTLNYLNNILAATEAKNSGANDALLLNSEGYVAESSGSNVFFVKDNVITTPSVDMGILRGVTRATILALAKSNGYTVQERAFYQEELENADEVFLTGTAMEIMPVYKLNDKNIRDGKVGVHSKKIMQLYKDHIVESPGYKV